jgi:hypothetical protein
VKLVTEANVKAGFLLRADADATERAASLAEVGAFGDAIPAPTAPSARR